MDTLMERQAHRRRSTPTSAASRAGASCRRASREQRRRRDAGRGARRAPTSPTDVPIFTPPFLGARVAKGISLDEIAGYVNETALFRNQWQFRPEKARRDRRRVQGAHPPDAARASSTSAKAGGLARARGRVGLLPGQRRGQRPRRLEGRRPHAPSGCASTSRASARTAVPLHRRLLPAGRVRRRRLRRLPRGDDGPARRRERERELFAANQYQEYLLLPRPLGRDDRGARRALAPPHPRGVGLRRRGRPDARRACSASSTAARATRGATRRAPTSRTRRSSSSCSSSTASACTLTEEFQLEPEQSTSAIIVPHPEAKYFIA